MKISVIVPIFNAEKTLQHCIDSILSQTYKDFELILINDGSKDASQIICESYCKIDSRVKLINKLNGGVSSARNEGIICSTGEYLTFIDSDDFVDPDFLLSFQVGPEHADLYIQGYKVITGKVTIIKAVNESIKDSACIITHAELSGILNSPWTKLFRKKIIDDNGVFFNKELSFGEDHIFVLDFLKKTKSISYTTGAGYNYKNDVFGSLSNKSIPIEQCCKYLNIVHKSYGEIISMHKNHTKILKSAFNYRLYSTLIKMYLDSKISDNPQEKLDYIRENLREVSKDCNIGLNIKQIIFVNLILRAPACITYRLFQHLVKS